MIFFPLFWHFCDAGGPISNKVRRDNFLGARVCRIKFSALLIYSNFSRVEEYLVTRSTHYRSQVHAYLCGFLPCGKQTLVKRAAKLVKSVQEDNINPLLAKLVQGQLKVIQFELKLVTSLCLQRLTKSCQVW